MNELVQRLSEGKHLIEVSLQPSNKAIALKECIDRGYVYIKFTETKGGTDLSVELDKELSSFNEANFDNQQGYAHIVGHLTLNYVKVRCIADINLEILAGQGHLELIEL